MVIGQTAAPFKAFIRLLFDDIEELKKETDKKKREEKIDRILRNLQNTLED